VFFQRIASIAPPRTGQISDVNFTRKIAPLVHPEKGLLKIFPLPDQTKIIDNYYIALRDIFPEEFRKANSYSSVLLALAPPSMRLTRFSPAYFQNTVPLRCRT